MTIGQIGRRFNGLSHQRPLFPIALSAGTEHANQPARRHLAQRPEHACQRIGRVGVIDKHAERLAAFDPFHPAGNFFQTVPGLRTMSVSFTPYSSPTAAAVRQL